jgi:putative NADH-flavin reductase
MSSLGLARLEAIMKVTVFGATGGIGTEVVAQLLDAGHEVVAVIRNGARFPVRRQRLAIEEVPSLATPGPLLSALQGTDAVISAVGPRSLKDGPVASNATRAILNAMAQMHVRRLVAISASPVAPGAEADGFLLRRILRPLIKAVLCDLYIDLARMEGELEQSGVDWTVIRPPRLVDGRLTGAYRSVIGGNVPNGYVISRADAAHAMVSALANPGTIRQPVGVAD